MPGKLVKLLPYLFIVCFGISFAVASVAPTQFTNEHESWLRDWPKRLPSVEAAAAMELRDLTDESRLQLITWLVKDNQALRERYRLTQRPMGEGFGDYYIALVLLVAKMKDVRSVDILARTMDVAPSVSTTLAEFGDLALEPVVTQLSDPSLELSAIYTLGKFVLGKRLGRNMLSEDAAGRIRSILLGATASRSGDVRVVAVQAIAQFHNDTEVRQILRRLAKQDPFVRSRQADGARLYYPVREAAAAALRLDARE